MAIENEIFTDGVYQVHMLEQTIRMDFMRLQPSPANKTPVPKPFERLILTPQAFLRTYEAMGQIVQKMEEMGLIRRGKPGDAPEAK